MGSRVGVISRAPRRPAPAECGLGEPCMHLPRRRLLPLVVGRWHFSIRVASGILGGCHSHLPACHHIPVRGLLGVSEAYFSKSQPIHPGLSARAPPSALQGRPLSPTHLGSASLGEGWGWAGLGCVPGAQLWRHVASPRGVELSPALAPCAHSRSRSRAARQCRGRGLPGCRASCCRLRAGAGLTGVRLSL